MQTHATVLQNEAVDALTVHPGTVIVDATLGSGGHTQEILSRLGEGTLVALDADPDAIAALSHLVKDNVHLINQNFRNIDIALRDLDIEVVDGILADLGWRMEQFSGNGRGFSFRVDEPLFMTYGDPATYAFTAQDIVNEWKEEDINNVLRGYGEERFSRRIAKAIVRVRETEPINSSFQLKEIIETAVPGFYRHGRIHPATRTFQALRIAVNDELDALREFIDTSARLLAPGGKLAIITFHSIEDRIVKHTFKDLQKSGFGTILTKKPITPTEEELTQNPRARSAKLRVITKHEET